MEEVEEGDKWGRARGWRRDEGTAMGRDADSLYFALTGPRPEPFLPQVPRCVR